MRLVRSIGRDWLEKQAVCAPECPAKKPGKKLSCAPSPPPLFSWCFSFFPRSQTRLLLLLFVFSFIPRLFYSLPRLLFFSLSVSRARCGGIFSPASQFALVRSVWRTFGSRLRDRPHRVGRRLRQSNATSRARSRAKFAAPRPAFTSLDVTVHPHARLMAVCSFRVDRGPQKTFHARDDATRRAGVRFRILFTKFLFSRSIGATRRETCGSADFLKVPPQRPFHVAARVIDFYLDLRCSQCD